MSLNSWINKAATVLNYGKWCCNAHTAGLLPSRQFPLHFSLSSFVQNTILTFKKTF